MNDSDRASTDLALIDHLESFLGQIDAGWNRDADGVKLPYQIARYPRGHTADTVSFTTLGLHRNSLLTPSGKTLHLELFMVVPKQLWSGPIPGLLQGIANEILDSRQPLLRGDVIGPRGPLVSGSDMTSLYAAIPVYFPDSFASCRVGDTSIAIVWLIPISSREAAFVRENGWPAFEELLVQIDPDLTNPFRPSIV